MSFEFVQCRTEDEAEAEMKKVKAGFVSKDHRIYSEISFWDDEAIYEIPGTTLKALFDLQHRLEMVTDGVHELPFTELVSSAKSFQKCFDAGIKAIKFKPLIRTPKGVVK